MAGRSRRCRILFIQPELFTSAPTRWRLTLWNWRRSSRKGKRKERLRFGSTIPRASLQTIKSSFITQARTCSIAARGTSRRRESWAWALQILSRSIIAELPNKDCLTKMNQTRSEERRVGKEYKCQCSLYHSNKKVENM